MEKTQSGAVHQLKYENAQLLQENEYLKNRNNELAQKTNELLMEPKSEFANSRVSMRN